MADAIKSLLLEIETNFKSKGIDQAKKSIGGLSTSTEDFVKRINSNIDKIGTTLDKVGNKKIGIKGLDAEIRDLTFLKKALQGIAAQIEATPDVYSEEQIEAGQKLIALTEEYTKKLNEQADAAKGADNTSAFLESVQALTPALGEYAYAADRAIAITREYIEASKKGEAASSTLGKALTFLGGTWGKVAAGIAAVIGSLVAATKYSGELEDSFGKLGTKFEIYLASAARGIGFIGEAFAKLAQGNFKEAFDLFIKGLTFTPNTNALDAYANKVEEIQDLIISIQLENSRLTREYAEQLEIISDEKKNLIDVQRAREAINAARLIGAKISENELNLAKQNLQLFDAKNQILGINPNDLTDSLKQERAILQQRVEEAGERAAQIEKQLNRQEKALNAFEKAFIEAFNNILKELGDTLDEFNFNDRFNKIFTFQGSDYDREKLSRDLIKAAEDINNRIQELKDKTGGGLDIPIDIIIDTNEAITKLTEFSQQLLDFNETVRQELAKGPLQFLSTRGGITINAPKLDLKIKDTTKKLENEDGANRKKRLIEEQKQNADKLFGELNDLIEIEKAKTDALIAEQEKRVEKSKEISALGNAEQLQLEEERLNKLLDQQREYNKRQREIQAIQRAADTAFAIAEFVAGAAQAFAKNPFAAVLEIGALVASVFAGIAALRSASQGFEAGTDYVTDGSQTFSKRGPTDTIPAWLAPGEMVIPKGIADKIRAGGYGVSDIPNLLPGDSARGVMSMIRNDNRTSVMMQTSKMEKLLEENNKLIKENTESIGNQLVRIEYDGSGHTIKQRRLARQEEKRRNGRR